MTLPLKTDSSAFKSGIAAAGVAVAALVAGMGLAIKATFKWADELDSITDVMGVSNKTAAALNFTLRKSGVATETLTKGMVILSKNLIKADGSLDTTGKSLKAWGIDVLDANGMLKDQTTLIGEISDKYASFATQQEKVNFLTETFGRSGAELIDFFDTLANDGGIDAVAAKIERLGLAIDPNRYEQFNRNIEELKLVGLAMAVGFTEKVMPAIEGFLALLSDPNLTLSGFAAKADDFIGGLIENIANSVDAWVSGGGPDELSNKIISWVENIGTGGDFESKILTAAENLLTGLSDAFAQIDWSGIAATIDNKMTEAINQADWSGMGARFGEALDSAFAADLEVRGFPTSIEAFGHAVDRFFQGATGADKFGGWKNFFDEWGKQTVEGQKRYWSLFGALTVIEIARFFGNLRANFLEKVGGLDVAIGDRLTMIAKTFFNRAAGWGNQMLLGFAGSQGALFSAISGMVQEINGLLRKIITSFHLTITYSEPTGSMGGGNRPRPGGTTGGNSNSTPRASGGPVIGGQSYSVAEFFRPERFMPNASGRIDPIQSQSVVATIDEARLARVIVQALMQSGFSG